MGDGGFNISHNCTKRAADGDKVCPRIVTMAMVRGNDGRTMRRDFKRVFGGTAITGRMQIPSPASAIATKVFTSVIT